MRVLFIGFILSLLLINQVCAASLVCPTGDCSVLNVSDSLVGIGRTSPGGKLHVVNPLGSPAHGLVVQNYQTGNYDGLWVANFAGIGRGLVIHNGATGLLMEAYYYDGSSYFSRFQLNNNGNLWIAGALTQNSDVRLKKDIAPLDAPLDKLALIRGVRFHWKDPARGKNEQLGVLAQDVEKVYPQLVQTMPDGTKSVNYPALVAPLLEAIKSLDARVKILEAQTKAP